MANLKPHTRRTCVASSRPAAFVLALVANVSRWRSATYSWSRSCANFSSVGVTSSCQISSRLSMLSTDCPIS